MFEIISNLFKEKIFFDFGGRKRTDDIKYPTPKKALCPANSNRVKKYEPIQYNIAQGVVNVSVPSVQGDEQQETPLEYPQNLPLYNSKAKGFTLRIQPIRFTKKVRDTLVNFARMQPRVREKFLEEAKLTLTTNISQIAKILQQDLANHIDNMRTVYDIFSTLENFNNNIKNKYRELADAIEKGVPPDTITEINAEIAELQQARDGLNVNYAAPLRAQHASGRRLVYHMKNRINKSLDEIDELKAFYCTVCRTIGLKLPEEFRQNRTAEEAALVKETFEREVLTAMKRYGMILREDGTLEASVIDIGGEDDASSNNETSEADS